MVVAVPVGDEIVAAGKNAGDRLVDRTVGFGLISQRARREHVADRTADDIAFDAAGVAHLDVELAQQLIEGVGVDRPLGVVDRAALRQHDLLAHVAQQFLELDQRIAGVGHRCGRSFQLGR